MSLAVVLLDGHRDDDLGASVAQAASDAVEAARQSLGERPKRTMSFLESGWPASGA